MNRHTQAAPECPGQGKEREHTSHVPGQRLYFTIVRIPAWPVGHLHVSSVLPSVLLLMLLRTLSLLCIVEFSLILAL